MKLTQILDFRRADWRCAVAWWPLGIMLALALVSTIATHADEPAARPTPPPFYRDKLDLMHWLDDRGQRQPVRSIDDWQKRRGHILRNFELATGSLPGADRKVPLDVRVTEVVQLEKYERRKLTFATEHNDRVPAYLLIPKEIKGQAPAMLCLHQTTAIGSQEPVGLGGSADLHYAAELAERGYVTLAPDYPYLGENKFDPYKNGYVSGTMKGIWNHMRAIDLLQSLTEVDGQRIGAIGHSLGGHNSLFVAAYDERVRCVVSCCGYGTNEEYFKKHKFLGGEGVRYFPRIKELTGGDVQRMPFDIVEIAATLAPRPFLTVAPLRDSNFPVKGLTDAQQALTPLYKLHAAEAHLTFDFPDAEHTFPPASREKAYTWLDRWLKPNAARPKATKP